MSSYFFSDAISLCTRQSYTFYVNVVLYTYRLIIRLWITHPRDVYCEGGAYTLICTRRVRGLQFGRYEGRAYMFYNFVFHGRMEKIKNYVLIV